MSKITKWWAIITLLAVMTAGMTACKTTSGGTGTAGSSETSATENITTPSPVQKEDPLKEILQSKHTLRFHEDGSFKILVLSDIHGQSRTLNAETKNNIKTLVDRENPDLVIFDGDNTWQISSERVLKECIGDIVGYIEERQIPWAHTYGNHDAEGGNVPKEKQQKIYESFDYCLSKAGDSNLTGVGNYLLPVYRSDSDQIAFAVWALDSGSDLTAKEKKNLFKVTTTFPGNPGSNYDYIRPNQIQWYCETSKLLQEQNGGKVVPGLMAFHIPLQESYTAWENRKGLSYTGEKRENVCASAVNSGLFSALLERGDIKAVVNGHDHINDFMVEYCQIKLCQASTPTNESIYHDDDLIGGRVFVIRQDQPAKIETYISYIHEKTPAPDSSDVGVLESGSGSDFENGVPEFTVSGYNNDNSDAVKASEICVKVADGIGIGGSKGLSITRSQWNGSNAGNNAEFKWTLPQPGKLGENGYVRVWMDLSTNDMDFRKACWGVVEEYAENAPYRTDDYDTPSPFYYLADGSEEWITLSAGGDGCFGRGDGQSVQNFKGWFAFPVQYMRSGSKALTSDSVITGFYFYFCLASEEMAGKEVYIDEVTLVKDYTVFE